MPTREQKWATAAYELVLERSKQENRDEYKSVTRSFPALIHSSGLCQAVAFAMRSSTSKRTVLSEYLSDLSSMLGVSDLDRVSREAPVAEYQRLTRQALAASSWLKRYAEALIERDS